jgi:hypothetical protein
MYSAGGHYIGYKEVPAWHQWMNLPVALVALLSILLGLGVVYALNGKEMFKSNSRPPINITNDLPF